MKIKPGEYWKTLYGEIVRILRVDRDFVLVEGNVLYRLSKNCFKEDNINCFKCVLTKEHYKRKCLHINVLCYKLNKLERILNNEM